MITVVLAPCCPLIGKPLSVVLQHTGRVWIETKRALAAIPLAIRGDGFAKSDDTSGADRQ
jgi:hypothetical protein